MEDICDFFANDSCEVRQADDLIIPDDPKAFGVGPRFFIAFAIEYLFPPCYQMEDEDDYLLVVPPSGIHNRTSFYRICAPCKFLKSNNLTWKQISEMLTSFRVPIHKQAFMVHRIAACADRVANIDFNKRRTALPMYVSITVSVDYCVSELPPGQQSTCIKKAKKFSHLEAIAAAEAAVVALEKETIGETDLVKRCMVCLEGLQVGSQARRMPCRHVFHENCIFRWLRIAGFCPVCHVYLRPAA